MEICTDGTGRTLDSVSHTHIQKNEAMKAYTNPKERGNESVTKHNDTMNTGAQNISARAQQDDTIAIAIAIAILNIATACKGCGFKI